MSETIRAGLDLIDSIDFLSQGRAQVVESYRRRQMGILYTPVDGNTVELESGEDGIVRPKVKDRGYPMFSPALLPMVLAADWAEFRARYKLKKDALKNWYDANQMLNTFRTWLPAKRIAIWTAQMQTLNAYLIGMTGLDMSIFRDFAVRGAVAFQPEVMRAGGARREQEVILRPEVAPEEAARQQAALPPTQR